MEDFLANRYQSLDLNELYVNGLQLMQEFQKVGLLLFLIFINDLSNELSSNPRLFSDDTSLFSVVRDPNLSASALNNDLQKINDWAYQ